MSIISRAIPGLFGGVSQQIPAMRHPTQGDVQENGLSTVVAGLFKRPGSVHLAQLANSWASGTAENLVGNVHCHVIDRGAGSRFQAVIGTGDLTVRNLETGAAQNVLFQDVAGVGTGYPSYLTATNPSTAFRCITVADTTFLVNTEKTVTASNNDAASLAVTRGYVYVRSTVQLHTYTIRINGVDCSFASGSTPTVATITAGLIAAVNTAAGGRTAAAVAGINGLIQVDFSSAIDVTATDTFGNSTMLVLTNGVQKFSDLPPSFVNGVRIKIIGIAAGANVDPYYVSWNGKQWVETRAYGINTDLNQATMPYRLFKLGNDWVVRPTAWTARLVGDDNTNPMPSFVGRTIRDIFFYRNRLGVLAGDGVILSRAGDYFSFTGATATEVLDSDPIDLGGAGEAVDTLDWAVPFNQQLILWASSRQQFSLVAGDILSPATARLVPVTAFESVPSAKPKALGNRIVFPATINGFCQLNLYRVAQDTVSNTSEPLTDHVPNYIPISPRAIELSESAKVLAVVPPNKGNELYVFKYEDDGDKLSQRAWQKFTFTGSIIKAHWSGQMLYLTMLYRNATSTGASVLCLEAIDFSTTAVDPSLTFGMRLDRRVFVNGATASGTFGEVLFTATMPDSANLDVYRYVGTGTPVKLDIVSKTVNAATPTTVTFRVRSPDTTGTFVVGQPYTFKYTFTEVFMRDQEGVPIIDARLKLLKMNVRFVKTGAFTTAVETKAQGTYSYDSSNYSVNGQGIGLAGQGLGTVTPLIDGNFAIPIQAQAQGTRITIESVSHLPCNFPYAEWRGSINMKSAR